MSIELNQRTTGEIEEVDVTVTIPNVEHEDSIQREFEEESTIVTMSNMEHEISVQRDLEEESTTVAMSNMEHEGSVERELEAELVPTWKKQVTIRALLVSLAMSVLFTFIIMTLTLTSGITPSLDVSVGLLGILFVKSWTTLLAKAGMLHQPFTRQEHTVIRTCVAASSGIALSGFGSYLLGMSPPIAKQNPSSSSLMDTKTPALGWMIVFLFVISFLGLFLVVPLRKLMIVNLKLKFPSATATADLINNFHTTEGAKLAKKQIQALGKFFSFSFAWGFIQWFFTAGYACGFASFPTFGLEAYKKTFYFDFSATYVGVGMMTPYIMNISLLIGGLISWAIMWPLIDGKKGDWYPADLDKSSLNGLRGYKISIVIAMVLGDGLYTYVKVVGLPLMCLYKEWNGKDKRVQTDVTEVDSFDDKQKTMFLKDQIPSWFAISSYVLLAIISTFTIPYIFHQLKWYYILCFYIIAPTLAISNACGCGLTDFSLASIYGKLAVLIISAWVGSSNGGVLVGLVSCGVMMGIVSTASDLMQDFKIGYMTLASPKSIIISKVIGTGMGCVVSPCVFWLFYNTFPSLGQQGSAYPAPYAQVYRNMAILSVDGVSTLPKNCLVLCYWFFAAAIVINLLRDLVGSKYAGFIPIPSAMAIPFYIGSNYIIDMCVGSLILFIWQSLDRVKADAFGSAVASGLICGEGIWSIPNSFLTLIEVQPPICMKFLFGAENAKFDKF